MYYPSSQIITNLYTNGEEYVLASDYTPYSGSYWKTSQGKFFTGKNPQDTPIEEIIKNPSFPLSSSGTAPNASTTYMTLFPSWEFPTWSSNPNAPSNIGFSISNYLELKKIDVDTKKIVPFYCPNIPMKEDYQLGEYIRYFCRKTNMLYYLEISKDMYDNLLKKDPTVVYQFYQPFSIPWKLTGNKENVYKTNRNIVKLAMKEKKLYSFDLYLKKDYIKYYLEN